jgi:hypothetical protein
MPRLDIAIGFVAAAESVPRTPDLWRPWMDQYGVD